MKIQKFNESTNVDNLYKNSILYESVKLKEESIKIIEEYFEYNSKFKEKYFIKYAANPIIGGVIPPNKNVEYNEIVDFEMENNRLLLINKKGTQHWLTQSETLGLLKFMNNPDLISLIRSQKKYNI